MLLSVNALSAESPQRGPLSLMSSIYYFHRLLALGSRELTDLLA